MWMKNCWYVAGFSAELDKGFVARRILDVPVIFWRTSDNAIAALRDRCPHRLAPLSTGKLVGDQIECGYHGLRFDASGKCTFAPGQDSVPRAAPAATFPAIEKHKLLWVWLGQRDLANESLIPDLHWMDAPGWKITTGYHHMKADYRLVNDNLLDLSHETYVHKHTVGNAAVADSPVVTEVVSERIVRAHREMPNIEPPPFFALAQGHSGRINRWQVAIYMAPGFNMTEVGFHAVGTDRQTASFLMRPLHLITPETEHSCHYFWAVPRNFRLEDDTLSAGLNKAASNTFDEDKALLELQQRCLIEDGSPRIPQVAVSVDVAPAQGRRILADAIAREKANPLEVNHPISLADDKSITRPGDT
jgi:phenylpropionate dioxygenase-like ring-hydroxylating dioxygenase large terminal subunit